MQERIAGLQQYAHIRIALLKYSSNLAKDHRQK